jgi:2-polyprenyl-3-methyl-5-hydroxy-6-metoxy-1,4-benzoquinol methylase
MSQFWNERFATDHYIFGTEPNEFLASQAARLRPGMRALAVADGEGRNGVWLARQGLDVHAVDASSVALAKAARLAATAGVTVRFDEVDLLQWTFPVAAYELVVGIFFQFAPPPERMHIIDGIKQAVVPGGEVILQGYTPAQLAYATGGPKNVEQLWTASLLRDWFDGWELIHLAERECVLNEGPAHSGMSAVVEMVARRPTL